MNKKNIKEYIKALDHMRGFFDSLLENMEEEDLVLEEKDQKILDFTNLRLAAKSTSWPEAVPAELICGDTEEEKLFRAHGIIDDFEINTANQRFLDFGCGEGHIAYVQSQELNAKISVGYDVKDQNWSHFNKLNNLVLTTSWTDVEENGPYDIIFCNDVLDHTDDPLREIKKIQKIKTPLSKIIVRVHPWTSRHGSHLYKQLNKAYLHLIFSDDELFSMGIEPQKIKKIKEPLDFYRKIFLEAGFTITKEEKIIQEVEDFFDSKKISNRLKNNFNGIELDQIKNNMEIQFIDFTLV